MIGAAKYERHHVFCRRTADGHATRRGTVEALVRQFESDPLLSGAEQNQNKADGGKYLQMFGFLTLHFARLFWIVDCLGG